MRKILISLLLAGAAATPAIAGPHNWSNNSQAQEDRQQAREQRQQAREERQQAREDARAERAANRPNFNPQQYQVQQHQQQYVGHPQFNGSGGPTPQIEQMRERVQQNMQDRRDAREFRQSNRINPNVIRDRHPLVVSDVPRPGTQPPLRADNYRRNGDWDHNWNHNWRNDHRYDWRHYRNRHRSLFHLGLYLDPFGWGYQPFSIGWRMWPNYYGRQYWIDPGMYSLPYPPPGAVWIRYWNDALLIDTYTGTVIDVIPGFFW
jgi:Ni/Co efflux regulator RcnB